MRSLVITSALVLGSAAACVMAGAKPPVLTTLPVPTLQVHDQAEVTQDGIIVTVTPIGKANASAFPLVYKTADVTVAVDDVDIFGTPNGKKVPKHMRLQGTIVPLPAFHVRIVNDTGHVIRLTQSVFRLEDNTGKKYPSYAGTDELSAWYAAVTRASTPDGALADEILRQTASGINALVLLNRTTELLEGDEWSGFLVFNVGSDPNAYQSIMATVERFKLRLAEIPVETDDAGKATRTTEFTFTIDKAMKEIDAECPAGTTEPSWDVCNPTVAQR